MADTLSITTQLVGDKYEVTASLTSLDVLPAAIFLYENTGNTSLGEYQGVCQLSDLTTRQEFTGTAIDTFGNKFVRYTSMTKLVSTLEDASKVSDWVTASVTTLKQQMVSTFPETILINIVV
ncbi:MAG TPA: hypothetical protein VFM18_07785 [Methanosarcina sp.]|nr:hypothetical protein [Methanosarcina sp.]